MQSAFRAALIVALCLATPIVWSGIADARPESQQEYWARFDQRDWGAAVSAAQELVAAARENATSKPLDLAEALSLLGNAQLGKSDYPAAEAAFGEALEIVEQHVGRTSARLISPLRGLGYTLAAEGRHAEAVPHLDRGLLLAHRSYGLFDINQQGLLRQLAASLAQSGRVEEAERHMRYLLRVGERTYGRDDPQMARIERIVGDWYADVGMFQQARDLYRQAITLIEEELGDADLALVEPLRALAAAYTQEVIYSALRIYSDTRFRTDRLPTPTDADGTSNADKIMNPRYLDSEGEDALQRAMKILHAHPDAPRDALAETLVQAGDWFQIKSQPEQALRFYEQAASLMHTQTATQPVSDRPLLAFPVRVYYPTPPLAARNRQLPDDQVEKTFVQVEFTVTPEGEVEDAKVTEENGNSRQAAETLDAVRAARFRPKFVGGEPVETPGMSLREIFRKRKSTAGSPSG